MLDYLNAVDKIVSDNPSRMTDISKRQSLFGGGIPPILAGDSWEKRVALAMILGVCPIFLLRFPQITDAALLSFISTREEVLTSLAGASFLRNRFSMTSLVIAVSRSHGRSLRGL